MHFIDWFSTETILPNNHEDNPIRMPLHYALTPHPIPFEQRQKFCAFVVSNPICEIRNEAFHMVNVYKPVSSGGAYHNNIGGQLHLKYPGGGCGDISKHHFFAEHKFTLSFENSQSPGYLTEKLLHAKMAGCVPLYWGTAETDFNPQSFVNLSQLTSSSNIVDIVKRLEANPAMCAKIAATPPLDEPRKQAALNVISEMCRRLLEIASKPPVIIVRDTSLIDKTYMINLDTRQDRLESFTKVHPDIKLTRISAVNGKELKMTDALYQLCKNNTFQWKKSVIACALSHISVWSKIVKDNATYTLILEDDVRFKPGWQNYVKDIPADAELLYLGGVLPTNRHVLPQALEKVNDYWSKLKPNTFFTKEPVAHFHFCAYSYILTKRGAQKLLDYIQYSNDKLCIPCDHLINHPVIGLIKYILNETQTFCFQEEDAQYNESQFNDLHTEKKFDSDIYNNTECFSQAELIYQNIRKQTIYYIEDKPDLYELTWLQDMFQKPIEFLPLKENIENAWCLVQRPYVDKWNMILNIFEKQEVPFNVLHLSDEFGTDPIDFYELKMCKKVIRNYIRPLTHSHVHTIPLGYHHKSVISKSLSERSFMWSFHGTDWFNRSEQLKQFMAYEPYNCSLQPQWKDPNRTKMTDYLELLGNSKFCPILKGNNMETFRLYEALEAGVLPVAVESNEYTAWIDSHLQLSELYCWTDPAVIQTGITDETQKEVGRRWAKWKEEVKALCKN
jgi:GR25 family glycosyltransferase involved in LPS biosynthesis